MARRNSRIPTVHDVPLPGMPTPPPRGQVRSARQAARELTSQQQGGSQQDLAAKAENARKMTYDTAMSIQDAKQGDDTSLLPYQPTPSINPPRPRTLAAGYDRDSQILRVRFRDGAIYEYYNVPERVWRNFKRVKSPGRAVNRVLNQYPYAQMDIE